MLPAVRTWPRSAPPDQCTNCDYISTMQTMTTTKIQGMIPQTYPLELNHHHQWLFKRLRCINVKIKEPEALEKIRNHSIKI